MKIYIGKYTDIILYFIFYYNHNSILKDKFHKTSLEARIQD
jgi:hypothetical protein